MTVPASAELRSVAAQPASPPPPKTSIRITIVTASSSDMSTAKATSLVMNLPFRFACTVPL